jgi:hypothetical protein
LVTVLQIHNSNGLMTSYPLLPWATDKQARQGNNGHLDFGMMIPIPNSNGLPTSRHPLILWSLASRTGHGSNGQGNFLKTFRHGRKLKSLIVEDMILPTPIKLNRVDKFLSSTVDYCWLWTIRIFNIISLHFGERCVAKIATLRCYVGSQASGPCLTSNRQTMMLARCYCGLRDVTIARCYCDRPGPIVSDLKYQRAGDAGICPLLL